MLKKQSTRNGALDFVKVIATAFIVFHHYQQYTGAEFDGAVNFYGKWFNFGLVTELFFMISGFLAYKYIAQIQSGQLTLAKWYLKKASRLLPVMAVSVLAYEAGLFIYHQIDYVPRYFLLDNPLDLFGTVIAMLGIQIGYGFGDPYINGPIWYVSILIACFIVLYAATALAEKLKCSPFYIYIAVIMISLSPLCRSEIPFLLSYNARGYYAFFMGIIVAHFIAKFGVSAKTGAFAAAVFAGITAVLIFAKFLVTANLDYVMVFIQYPAIILLCHTEAAQKIFSHKIWNTLGAITYNVYLWHVPMILYGFIAVDILKIRPDFANPAIMYIFTAAVFVIGTLSHFMLEKPLDKLVQNKIKKYL